MSETMITTWGNMKFHAERTNCDVNGNSLELDFDGDGKVSGIGGKSIAAGVGEAPNDGKQYARQDGSWVEVDAVEEAPTDDKQYARKNGAWAEVLESNVLDIAYESTPFDTLKTAYDNGQSVRMSSVFGSDVTLAPMFYQEDSGLDNVVEFGALFCLPADGGDRYIIVKVIKGENGASDTWVSHNETIGTMDVKKLSVNSSEWTGASTYTLQAKDAGKVVDFGTISVAVTGLTIKIPSGVNSAAFRITLPTANTMGSISVVDGNNNEYNVVNGTKPTSFDDETTINVVFMAGDVVYAVSSSPSTGG